MFKRLLPVVLLTSLVGVSAATSAPADEVKPPTTSLVDSLNDVANIQTISKYSEHVPGTANRYDLANGCFVIRSVETGQLVARSADGFTLGNDGEPFFMRALDLGKYLIYGTQGSGERTFEGDFLSAEPDPFLGGTGPVLDIGRDQVRGTYDESLNPVRAPILGGMQVAQSVVETALNQIRPELRTKIVSAILPSAAAEWVVRDTADGNFTIGLSSDDGHPEEMGPVDPELIGLMVAEGNDLELVHDFDLTDDSARFTFETASGCAEFPESSTDVDGDPAQGTSAAGEAKGYVDGHLHMMAFEFLGGRVRCGRPWHPYGVAYALVDCPDHEPGGHGAVLEHVLSGTDPVNGHATDGWPTFSYWPNRSSLVHEQVYYKWLERSWRSGLRVFTNLLVENGALCEAYPLKKNSCNEMDAVRLQAKRLRELERYIDAQSGGPGKGWFRIVENPFEARRVVNAGKLAVVMGIEISVLFDCGEYLGVQRCGRPQIDASLDEVYDMGVRQMEFVNKFDNALSGVTGDGGTTGIVVNQGNRSETGHFWRMDTCHDHASGAHDKEQMNFTDEGVPEAITGRDALAGGILAITGKSGVAPLYPQGPHCNTAGLTDLGYYLIKKMSERGMMFDPDHMSSKARQQAMAYVRELGYPGVISSHGWADDSIYRQVYKAGGFVTQSGGSALGMQNKLKNMMDTWPEVPEYFGFGYGSDTNGFAGQGGPSVICGYPVTGLGGVQINKQTSGERTFDIRNDGLAHYGLHAEWYASVGHKYVNGTPACDSQGNAIPGDARFAQAMERGAEAYLRSWEGGLGIQADSCPTASEVSEVSVGDDFSEVLAQLGQPQTRTATSYEYSCDNGDFTIGFDSNGLVSTVIS